MSLLGFAVLLVIAAAVGSLGQAIAGFTRGGCLAALIIGFVGAYIGFWLAQLLGLPTFIVLNVDGEPFPLIWAIIGATILSALLGLIVRRRALYD